MSIRLRLTLLYSAILALTLVLVGAALYGVVYQVTLNAAGVKYPDTLNATFDELVEKSVKLTKAADTQFGYSGASGSPGRDMRVICLA